MPTRSFDGSAIGVMIVPASITKADRECFHGTKKWQPSTFD